MTDSSSSEPHVHGSGPVYDTSDADINTELLNLLVCAAFDDCSPCTRELTNQIVDGKRTWAALVEWVLETAEELFGRLPRNLTDRNIPSPYSEAFRTLSQSFTFLGRNRRYGEWRCMSLYDRLSATESALALLADLKRRPDPNP